MLSRPGVLPLFGVTAGLLLASRSEGLAPVEGAAEQPAALQAELLDPQLLRPDGTVQSGWRTVGGGSAWEKLDELVTQPTPVPANNDYLWAGGAGYIAELSMANPSSYRGDPGEVTAWFYGNTGPGTQVRADAISGGEVRATVLIPAMAAHAWRSVRFTVRQRSELDDLRLRFRTIGGPDANIRAAYVEVSASSSYAVLGSAVKVRPHEFPAGPNQASLFAARNEFESFQVAVMAPHAPVLKLRASFPLPLTGPGGAVIPSRNFIRVFIYGCDEPHFFPVYGDVYNNWLLCKRQLAEAAKAWPEAPRLVTAHIQSAEPNGGVAPTDIMVINAELLHGPPNGPWYAGDQRPLYEPFLQDRSRPKELWLYAACGTHGCSRNNNPYTNGWAGYEIDAPASESRAMPWLAFRYNLTGTLYWDMAMLLSDAWNNQYYATGNGDGNMFYLGTPDRIGGTDAIPIESLRMKLVRDGYEDYEYLELLRRLGYGGEAREIARGLFPEPYDTARGDAQVQEARTRLARRLASLLGGPAP